MCREEAGVSRMRQECSQLASLGETWKGRLKHVTSCNHLLKSQKAFRSRAHLRWDGSKLAAPSTSDQTVFPFCRMLTWVSRNPSVRTQSELAETPDTKSCKLRLQVSARSRDSQSTSHARTQQLSTTARVASSWPNPAGPSVQITTSVPRCLEMSRDVSRFLES